VCARRGAAQGREQAPKTRRLLLSLLLSLLMSLLLSRKLSCCKQRRRQRVDSVSDRAKGHA